MPARWAVRHSPTKLGATALEGLCATALQQGQASNAVPLAARALAIRGAVNVPPELLANTGFPLARARWEASAAGSGEYERSLALAGQARALVAHTPWSEDSPAEIDEWLLSHPE